MASMAATYGLPQPPHAPGGAAPGAPVDAITKRLSEVSPRQMHDIMVQMRSLATANVGQARQLLVNNVALTRALFQAQLMLGMVASAAEGAPVTLQGQPQPPPQPQWAPPPVGFGGAPGPAMGGPPPFGGPPSGYPPQGPMGGQFGGAPPPQQGWMGGPPPMAAPAAAPNALAAMLGGMDPQQQQQLLQGVMALTDAQVAGLGEVERQQVVMLRELVRSGMH